MPSKYWRYFSSTDDRFEATCDLCDTKLKTSNNTTNLKQHLKRKHPSIFKALEDEKNVIPNRNNGNESDDMDMFEVEASNDDGVSTTQLIYYFSGLFDLY